MPNSDYMKIGLVSSDPFAFPGGIQEQVKGLHRYLKSEGHDTKVIAPRYNKEENYGKDFLLFGGDVPFPWNMSTGNISFCLETELLERTIKKEKFDILHFHNLGIFLPMQILNLSESKNVITIHVLPEGSLVYKLGKDIIKLLSQTALSDRFSSMIATSNPVLKTFNDHYDGPKYIIPNGIDLKRFSPKNEKLEEFHDDRINILFVGRLDKRKGLNYLIDAFVTLKKKHDNIRLIVVGGGFEKSEYEDYVRTKKIEDVVFAGVVDDNDLPKYYATCDIFCSPAFMGEGFGIVLLEAMASGKPVVGFANTGYKNVINDGIAAKYLVKPKDVKQLTKALDSLIENEKLRKKLGRWGLKESKKYSWKNVGKKVLQVYKKVL